MDVYVAGSQPDTLDLDLDALLVPGLHLGRRSRLTRFITLTVPGLLRPLTPAPDLVLTDVKLPLRRELGLERLSFAGGPLPLVIAPHMSAFEDDVAPRIFAENELGFGRCVLVQDVYGRPPAWPNLGVTLIAPDEWLGVLQGSYGMATKERYTTRISVEDLVKGARVAHVLGLATRTSRGPVIRLDSTSGATKARAWGSSFDASSAATLGHPWLTVLQTTPVGSALTTDSRSSALQRTLAREVQQATGGWVLTVPALSPRPAGALWDRLGEFAELRRPRRRHLVRVADAIKAELFASTERGEVDPRMAEDVARDVLLFGPWQET